MRFTFIKNIFLVVIFTFFANIVLSQQQYASIYGKVINPKGKPVEFVNVSIFGYSSGTTTDRDGKYYLKIPANKELKIIFSHVEFEPVQIKILAKPNQKILLNQKFTIAYNNIGEVKISDKHQRTSNLVKINPKTIGLIPNTSGGVEAILKTLPGVASNNEFSTQYSVRGGNYDENLVYVNDIEIYRPVLIRSGQQEGLSFVNSDLVSSIEFSAGGFDAKYGDKMSSVLDIKYLKPSTFGGGFSASLLGGSVFLQSCSDNHRFTQISGIRYKTMSYLLNSLDTKGDYKPSFSDFQTYMTYDVTDRFELGFLGNFSNNSYFFIPSDRLTTFGTVTNALGFKVYFDGQEKDMFTTYLSAVSGNYKVNSHLNLKLIASAFNTIESETYDIQGQYYLNELDKEIGSDNLGDSLMNIGVGTFLNHARNYLNAKVFNIYHKGQLLKNNHNILWGAKFQHEIISDNFNEWNMLDSAGYTLPYSDTSVDFTHTYISNNLIQSNRVTSYIQDNYTLDLDSSFLVLTAGIRTNFWTFSNQFLVSPRVSVSYQPNWNEHDIVFRLATGFYYQPPFQKEFRDLQGNINYNIKAQKSIHYVISSDYKLKIWGRPFKYTTEIYYKQLSSLIPYDIDNVRIRYYGKNDSKGYATGIDMKLFGEFVSGINSWASLSVMQTKEDINDDFYYDADSNLINPGYISRPSNQLVNFGLFFQDYLPKNPSFKMQLSLLFGSKLPAWPPSEIKAKYNFHIPEYRRVDIGFAKVLKTENDTLKPKNPFRYFKSIWITAEVFNLLGTKNTISYTWIKDIRNNTYGVPNYLSNRRLNVKLTVKF